MVQHAKAPWQGITSCKKEFPESSPSLNFMLHLAQSSEKKLNILNLHKLFIFHTLIASHKKFYSLSLSPSSTTHLKHLHFTRTSITNLPLPRSTSCGLRSPDFQVADLWNTLDMKLRSITKSTEFKRRYRKHLLQWALVPPALAADLGLAPLISLRLLRTQTPSDSNFCIYSCLIIVVLVH